MQNNYFIKNIQGDIIKLLFSVIEEIGDEQFIKNYIYIIGIIILITIIAFTVLLSSKKQYVSIQDDDIYFDMSKRELIKIKGNPVEVIKDDDITPFQDCYFKEKIYGQQAESSYSFYKTLFGLKMFRVYYKIDDIEHNVAESILKRIEKSLIEQYSKQPGYYNNGINGDGMSNLELALNVSNGGAIGIYYNIEYKNRILTIQIENQK